MTTTTDLIFEEPPAKGGSLGHWCNALREHPGQWAKYPEPTNSGNTSHIRKGKLRGIAAGEFEVRTVTIEGSTVWLYARYIGEAS